MAGLSALSGLGYYSASKCGKWKYSKSSYTYWPFGLSKRWEVLLSPLRMSFNPNGILRLKISWKGISLKSIEFKHGFRSPSSNPEGSWQKDRFKMQLTFHTTRPTRILNLAVIALGSSLRVLNLLEIQTRLLNDFMNLLIFRNLLSGFQSARMLSFLPKSTFGKLQQMLISTRVGQRVLDLIKCETRNLVQKFFEKFWHCTTSSCKSNELLPRILMWTGIWTVALWVPKLSWSINITPHREPSHQRRRSYSPIISCVKDIISWYYKMMGSYRTEVVNPKGPDHYETPTTQ